MKEKKKNGTRKGIKAGIAKRNKNFITVGKRTRQMKNEQTS